MQISIRDASRFVIGAAIVRDMALQASPETAITLENVIVAASRDSADGKALRESIETLAERESGWFRNTPPHAQATDRVMQSREHEIAALNGANLAALAFVEHSGPSMAGDAAATSAVHESLQAAIRHIDNMPGSRGESRALLQSLKSQGVEASGDAQWLSTAFEAAEQAYLAQLMEERLGAYQKPKQTPAREAGSDNAPDM